VATTANRETGKSAQLSASNAQHSAQAMREYAVEAGEINTEMAKRMTEVWVEGLQKHTQLSQKIAQEFFDKAEEQGHSAEGFFDRGLPSWWAPSSTYDPFAFWRMWAQKVQESVRDLQQKGETSAQTVQEATQQPQRTAAEETARVIESTAPWHGSLPIPAYDEKKVGEITSRLNALTDEQLRRVRDYERRNKNRETLVQEIDAKIRGAS
jgi:gas vesicle protein